MQNLFLYITSHYKIIIYFYVYTRGIATNYSSYAYSLRIHNCLPCPTPKVGIVCSIKENSYQVYKYLVLR